MEIKWICDAEEDYYNTLAYWYKHNGSYTYLKKIMKAVESFTKRNRQKSLHLANIVSIQECIEENFLDNRFVIYYKVIEDKNRIEIHYFRSTKQRPLQKKKAV